MERRARGDGNATDDSLQPPSWPRYEGKTHFSDDPTPHSHAPEAESQPPSGPRTAGQCVPRNIQLQVQRGPKELQPTAYCIASLPKPHAKLLWPADLGISSMSHLLQPFLSARTLPAKQSSLRPAAESPLEPEGATEKTLSGRVAPIVSKHARRSSPSPSHEPSRRGILQSAQACRPLLQSLFEPHAELKTSKYILGVFSPAPLMIPTPLATPLLSYTSPPADHLAVQPFTGRFLPAQYPEQRTQPLFASIILGASQQYGYPGPSGRPREPSFRKTPQEVAPAGASTRKSSKQPTVVNFARDTSTLRDRTAPPSTARAADSSDSAKTQEEAEPMKTAYYESYLMTSEYEHPYRSSEELQDTMFFMEPKFHGFVFTLLHSVSQALANIFIKRLVVVPKAQMAFFACFGIMAGGMPGTFSTSEPFGPKKAQALLLVRAIFGVILLMSKGMALTYLTVADVAIIFALIPVAASLGSWLYLREKFHRLQGLSIATGIVGVLMAMRPAVVFAETGIETEQLTGIMYALCCVISMSALIIVIRYMRNLTHKSLTFNNGCMRVVVAMLAAFVGGSFDRLLSGAFLGSLLLMGKINFCALFFLSKALEVESAVVVSTVKLCGDITVSVIFQAIFLDVYPDRWTFFGGLFVIASALIVTIDKFVHTHSSGFPFAIYNWAPFLVLRRVCNRFSPEEVEHF